MNKPGLLRKQYLFYGGLFMLAAGLPVSKFLTSFSQIVLLASFFLEGNLREKWQNLKANKSAWVIAGIWLMHAIGLLYSDQVETGTWDLRMKLPVLIITLVIAAAGTIPAVQVRCIFWVFTVSILAGTLVSTAVLVGIIQRPIDDIRDIFIFHISHIRFALFTCLSFYFLGYRMASSRSETSLSEKVLAGLLMAWFVVFLLLAESVTGLAILVALSVPALLALAIHRRSLVAKIAVLAVAVILPLTLGTQAWIFLREINTEHPDVIDPLQKTSRGNAYRFYPENHQTENGYRVWNYVNADEMRSAWNARSIYPYDSLDKKAQPLAITLLRYLTSKGSRKDAAAVEHMTDQEIRSVESGIANVHYMGVSSFKSRLLELNWEYQQAVSNQSPNGHSMAMRFEFWKAGWQILKQHPWTGVGTGDLQQAYDRQYDIMHSQLSDPWRLRAHNQYLSIALAFGVFGLVYFLLALFYPMVRMKKTGDFMYWIFLGIFLLSMLTEDTLETPAGSSFFALFNSLLLFSGPKQEDK